MRHALCLPLVAAALLAPACVITIPDSGDASGSAGASASAGESGPTDDPEAAELDWVYQPEGCGHAYGVVHRGDDAIVVGAQGGGPWIARIDAQGALQWQREDPRAGAYFAIDDQEDASAATASVVAVGRHRVDNIDRGLLDVIDDGGAVTLSRDNLGGPGSGLFGVAAVDGGYVVTGILGGFDVLLGVVDPGGVLALWDAPAGFGLTSSAGFGVRATADVGVVACGRSSTGEGGRSWTARYAGSGAMLWEALGPDPGVGAISECWGLSLGPGGDVFLADSGYAGARLAGHAVGDGALLWAQSEPVTGTQAIDVAADGTIYVGGWSADPQAKPFRSHNKGEQSGWLAAFDPGGTFLWQAHAAMPLSIFAVRVGEGFVTVVGDLDPGTVCPRPWIGRFSL